MAGQGENQRISVQTAVSEINIILESISVMLEGLGRKPEARELEADLSVLGEMTSQALEAARTLNELLCR